VFRQLAFLAILRPFSVNGMSRLPFQKYLVSLALVGVVFLLRTRVEGWGGGETSPLLYLPAVTLAAWYGGLGPGLLATLVGGSVWIYHDIPPIGSMYVPSSGDQFRVAIFAGESLLLSASMELLHASRRASDRNAREAERYRASSVRNEARLRAILDNSSTPIWMKDAEGRYLLVNKPFEALVRRRRNEVVGKTDTDLFLPPIAGPLPANDRAVLEIGRAIEAEETIDLDDGPHTFLSVKFPMHDDEGAIFAIGGISTDITDLKLAQRRAVQAERLAAIGQMVTGLAHESRNALQRSQACLEMLRFRLEGNTESLDLVTGIQDAQDDLQRLYEEVRTYAAPLLIDRREASLRSLVLEAWGQLEWTIRGRDVRLVDQSEGDVWALVDTPRMVQVFRNLLDNSLAACHDPVIVKVGWSVVEVDGRASLRITLRDNGPGFSPEQMRNLFEPFYTTKTQGTGLGMAIARRIVEAHGGSIAAELDDDAPGAEIVILLPRG
jgi:PAS domain S-box-containing protein